MQKHINSIQNFNLQFFYSYRVELRIVVGVTLCLTKGSISRKLLFSVGPEIRFIPGKIRVPWQNLTLNMIAHLELSIVILKETCLLQYGC